MVYSKPTLSVCILSIMVFSCTIAVIILKWLQATQKIIM